LPYCCGKALEAPGVVTIERPLESCGDCPLVESHADYGVLALPLEHGGRVYGVMMVTVHRNFVNNAEEQDLLREIAGDIAFALHDMEIEQERRRAEEKLREYSERLENMVEERTRELRETQEELIRKERLAVLGTLAGGVGHELRNPLGVISNAVYFLKTTLTDADETTREYLDIISTEIKNAERIVSNLLDFARKRRPERQRVSVSELIAGALERRPPPESVRVVREIPEDLPRVRVDPAQIVQVLENLFINAYEAMPEGGELTIRAQAEGEVVHVAVSDTGCGIPKDKLRKIFEPLFTTKTRGIGLGLAICRNLIEANGGTIEVQSTEGRGTTFTIAIPIGKDK